MEEVNSESLLIDTHFAVKDYETFPKKRDSNSTTDGNEEQPNNNPQSIKQKEQAKLLKSLKMSQFLNLASSYWVDVCQYK